MSGKDRLEEERALRRRFPNLFRELKVKTQSIAINSSRTSVDLAEETVHLSDGNRLPDAVDYIRRCGEAEEAEDVITYLERRGEISKNYAETLRRQLREHGLTSFGSRKRWGHYYKQRRG